MMGEMETGALKMEDGDLRLKGADRSCRQIEILHRRSRDVNVPRDSMQDIPCNSITDED